MPTRAKKHPADNLCEAVLKLAAKKAWTSISLVDISRAVKTGAQPRSKDEVIGWLASYVSRHTAKNLQNPDQYGTARDALFDLFMLRFEVMQAHRKAFQALFSASLQSPVALGLLAKELSRETTPYIVGKGRPELRKGASVPLLGAYFMAFFTWTRDDTSDMSKTMAALDRYLGHAEKLQNIVSCSGMNRTK